MIHQNLQHTVFHIEPLKNIVGVGSATAYQICLAPGKTLGQIGAVIDPAIQKASNDHLYAQGSNMLRKTEVNQSWFRRLVSTLKR
ncbi:MAG: hypothetical protein GWP58_15035 [Gammaproteobacteria bacterium]|jgi:hypothetical protein|nr:hypothetical protein [Gammaproteobacteria bacterium]